MFNPFKKKPAKPVDTPEKAVKEFAAHWQDRLFKMGADYKKVVNAGTFKHDKPKKYRLEGALNVLDGIVKELEFTLKMEIGENGKEKHKT